MATAFRMIKGKVKKVKVEGCSQCGATVGTFTIVNGKKYCKGKCRPALHRETAKSTFPFTTTNLGPDPRTPVTVNSMRHLRQLEREYGVQSVAYNQDSKNFEK